MGSKLAEMFGGGAVETFLGVPGADLARLPDGCAAVILGADTATPYASVGAYCAGGAAAIRAGAADFAANLGHVNFEFGAETLPDGARVVDAGDLPVDVEDAALSRSLVSDAVRTVAEAGAVPVVLGGDDSLPFPVIQALDGAAADGVTIVQVDAHLDWRDDVQGERFGLSSPMRRASEMAHVRGITQIGLRGIGSARESDLADARRWGAELIPMRNVARDGLEQVIARLPEGRNVVLAFDFDALDPSIMPAVIARTPGGLDYWSALEIIAALIARNRLRAVTFCEFMAERDIDGQGARSAAGLVAATLGCIARAARSV